ncbi:Putative D-/L-hydantoinase subunit A-like protein [Cladobotryum mycophilum]|uniref:D-/L-hydantoinase subunit A-like protein n=1 Tax=Cladobotryum mycophilum TaxID=491253 RepID=A0ABR0SUY2_9HYPO
MALTNNSRRLRIGVDVGGTNTDGVILDPLKTSSSDKGILAWHKAPTTTNPSIGINEAIAAMFEAAAINPDEVACVTIGTTQFVNAVVERDASRLSTVAVIRLCGPYSKHAPPCVDWPDDMRQMILGHYALLKGGLEVDGNLISDIDEKEIKEQCVLLREKNIRSIVVNGVFSPIDTIERQEERVAEIIRTELPGRDVVCAKEIANLGFLERENAAILNASILNFARKTIRSFQEPIRRLGLHCPVFITQNDGTVLSGEMAARLPIRTFSSGPTNSMRGAAFLAQGQISESVMVVDIGGTTTDVGLLHANGFPRQQAAYSELAGIRMNFSCPDIRSIGLGGGSIVRIDNGLTIGPDSVGSKLLQESKAYGGPVLTATDCMIQRNPDLQIGRPEITKTFLSDEELSLFSHAVRSKIEKVIDKMKTSPADIPVVLVGGGAPLAPRELKGASRVLIPKWSGVANAIGAAMARVSAVVDTVRSTELKTTNELLEEISKEAIAKTIAAGASPETVKVVEMDSLPLQYISHKTRFIVRAAGDFDFSSSQATTELQTEQDSLEVDDMSQFEKLPRGLDSKTRGKTEHEVDIVNYKPAVRDRIWYISETDVEWISTGCYILGTGGGGSPYSHMVRLREELRKGAIVRVMNPNDLANDDQVGCGGGVGSPTVGIEKLPADELLEAQTELFKICPRPATHMIAIEIGGGNGLQAMILGASTNMDIPAVDGDWMGRAYPTKWQTTPVVFNERSPIWSPIAMSDGNGNVVLMPKATSDHAVERILRAALTQMGSLAGCAEAPVTGAETKRWVVEHTISQAWRIGRGVARARKENRVDNVAESIIEECGGARAGKVLWKGKIVGVERVVRGGYAYGECIIEGLDVREDEANPQIAGERSGAFQGKIKIPFKNENIAALRMRDDGQEEQQEDVLAIAPDLITIIDAQNGEAIGTPEYRYGLLVVVLGLAASDKWTSTERGIKLGGPEGFGFDHLKYTPLGTFVKPQSVIDEFDASA